MASRKSWQDEIAEIISGYADGETFLFRDVYNVLMARHGCEVPSTARASALVARCPEARVVGVASVRSSRSGYVNVYMRRAGGWTPERVREFNEGGGSWILPRVEGRGARA